MNRSALKKYAPQARLDFIAAVTLRARRLGLDPALPVNIEQTGDVLLIGGQPFPASIGKQRDTLALRIYQQGFSAVVEALAYTWFNRLVAIRFMELKGYLSHGYRVLSHPQGQQPEILDNIQHLDLFGLDKSEVIRLKTAGDQDEALYREILLAQCHELHRYMPFLFESLDDATELLLPDNLLRTDSPIARLVDDIEEGDWQEVEVIGWLYQFYINEKKAEVVGRVVESKDIPAATQLFTPNWIVQYLVQNSIGRLWLSANPESNLIEKMPYYVEPAEQNPEVLAQLDALIQVRMDEDSGSLNPESLTLIDPACGSGHILVEAYNLLRAIYEERGYRLRDIPRLILQKNLYGLDIDDRATQLAGFALLMKAREDDRRLFDDDGNAPQINVMAIHQSEGLPHETISNNIISAAIQLEGGDPFLSGQLFGGGQLKKVHSSGVTSSDIEDLIQLFQHGKTYGSLLQVPSTLQVKLGALIDLLAAVRRNGDDLSRHYANQVLEQFALPASLLSLRYDAVVANPPYMGGKGFNEIIKKFLSKNFPACKENIFSAFIMRNLLLCRQSGLVAMITMHNWMFTSRFEKFRLELLQKSTVETLHHLGVGAFEEINGEVVQTVSFVLRPGVYPESKTVFVSALNFSGEDKKNSLRDRSKYYVGAKQKEFDRIPGSPFVYWLADDVLSVFSGDKMGDFCEPREGLATGNNEKYVRFWHEVDVTKIGRGFGSRQEALASSLKWFPYNKGGENRKWYGNIDSVVDWSEDGFELQNTLHPSGKRIWAHNFNLDYIFKEGATWTDITSTGLAVRYLPEGCLFDATGLSAFYGKKSDLWFSLAVLNSSFSSYLAPVLNPTLHFKAGDFRRLPVPVYDEALSALAKRAVDLSKGEWDLYECSLDYSQDPLVSQRASSVAESFDSLKAVIDNNSSVMAEIENSIDRNVLKSFGLAEDRVYQLAKKEKTLDRSEVVSSLLSYFIGCLMGRYSLDERGLIYAHHDGVSFDSGRYVKFSADPDGIVPVTDEHWFEDDAAARMREFIGAVWGQETLVGNMEWLAECLGRKAGESADESVRRYFTTSFYKNHLQTYKKRPIYWLFSSGKQKAFECLVYLHRYNEGTLSRMRMEYVVPLQSRMQARIDKLTDDINSATSSAQQKALQKRKDKFTKQLEELRRFDEALRPYADQRIALNLDDGVKVNYGKFGDLLAEVKAITGSKED